MKKKKVCYDIEEFWPFITIKEISEGDVCLDDEIIELTEEEYSIVMNALEQIYKVQVFLKEKIEWSKGT